MADSLLLEEVTSPRKREFRTPFFLIWSLPRLWYGSLSGSISLSHLSIFNNISCYNSLVLLTFVSRSSCRFTLKKKPVRNSSACGVNGWKFYKTQTSKKWHTIILRKCEVCPNKMEHKLDKQWLFIFLQNMGPILVVSEPSPLIACHEHIHSFLADSSGKSRLVDVCSSCPDKGKNFLKRNSIVTTRPFSLPCKLSRMH
jgi:hypothetical protein